MTWVRRVEPQHKCEPPTRHKYGADWEYVPPGLRDPAGNPGDLWRCDHCRELWQITARLAVHAHWELANGWQRLRYAFRRHRE